MHKTKEVTPQKGEFWKRREGRSIRVKIVGLAMLRQTVMLKTPAVLYEEPGDDAPTCRNLAEFVRMFKKDS